MLEEEIVEPSGEVDEVAAAAVEEEAVVEAEAVAVAEGVEV